MRNCYVPKCDYKNKYNPKRAMFNVPIKNPPLFRKWQNILPVHHRPLKEFDRICEQHFREEDILRYWEHTINGTVERMARHKPLLKPNAIPVFVEVDHDEITDKNTTSTLPKRKYRKKSESQSRAKTMRQDIEVQNVDELVLEGSSINQSTLESDADPIHLSIQDVSEVVDGQAVEHNIVIEMTHLMHPEFETLFDEVYEVELPSTLWGIHRDLEKTFICFSEFSKDTMTVRKYLFIDRFLQYRMAVGQRVMKRGTLPNGSTESISELLTKLDEVKIRKVIIKGSSSVFPES
ncbi:uncharacterized protein LOC135702924 [Ochlerotatus camptorhynchus]|uniref:uncharacterized protein LOC135702924 n=1 Tax=Ochlerotatus camptorhynchus TaxID=644619 RepID=UPI0031D3BFD1